eukprot:gene17322-21887_t
MRGVWGETLSPRDAWAVGRSFATVVRRAGGMRVAVGYDGRLSSPKLEAALVQGLCDGGITVRRIGPAPTPLLYYAVASAEDVHGGIEITGSHNPKDHNGFKILRPRPIHRHQPRMGLCALPEGEMQHVGGFGLIIAIACGAADMEMRAVVRPGAGGGMVNHGPAPHPAPTPPAPAPCNRAAKAGLPRHQAGIPRCR